MWPFRRRASPSALTVSGSGRVIESTRDEFIRDDFTGETYQGRAAGGTSDDADLSDAERVRAVRLSRKGYKESAAYGGVLDRLLDFLVGDGVEVVFKKSPVSQGWVDHVFQANGWERRLKGTLRRLLVDGEYLLSVSAPEREPEVPTANLRLGRLDPEGIERFRVSRLDRDDVRAVVHKHDAGAEPVVYPIAEANGELVRVLPTKDEAAAGVKPRLAAVAYWRVNALGLRGAPLLLRVIDKSSVLDEAIDNIARKAEYVNRFYLHVTYRKANDESRGKNSKDLAFERKVLKWATKLEPGACLVTGDDVKVTVHAPDLKLVDMKALYEILLEWVLGSNGMPRMWFSSGGDTNRATAAEQGTPLYRSIRSLQADVQEALRSLVQFILWMGERAGLPGVKHTDEFDVVMADVATRDSERDVRELAQLSVALEEMVSAKHITKKEARAIGRKVIASKPFGDQLEDGAVKELEASDQAPGASGIEQLLPPIHRLLRQPANGQAAAEEGTLPAPPARTPTQPAPI